MRVDLPPCPNVDAFNYENLKAVLLERLDLFNAAPFTVQRLCELLTNPKKHYCRLDKFMRALEKTILGENISGTLRMSVSNQPTHLSQWSAPLSRVARRRTARTVTR